MPEIVTELTVDARGAEQGARAYAASMDLAEAAGERVVNQTRALEGAVTNQVGTMTRVAGSTSNAARSFERLRNSVDPAARAQANLERTQRTLDRAVAQGITTQDEANRVLDLARQKYDATGREANQYGRDVSRAERLTEGVSRATSRLIGLLGSLGLALGIRQIIEYADAWTNAGNRIAAVGNTTAEEADRIRGALTDLAVETRSSFDATLTLFSRLQVANDSLGASEDDLLTVVRTVNEAMTISGASAAEAEGAIRQLGQALGSGALRGDELNSILEQAPILARAVAEEMGVSITQLRELGTKGSITADIVFNALLSSSDAIHDSFAATQTTVGQAITNLQTRFIEFVGGANDATGATNALAGAIEWIGENIGGVITALGVLATTIAATFVIGKVKAFAEAVGNLPATIAQVRTAFSFLLTNPFGLAITAIATIAGGLLLWKSRTDEASFSLEQHEEMVQGVRAAYEAAGGAVDDWASRIESATVSQALLDVRARIEDLDEATQRVAFSWLRPTPDQEQLTRNIETMRDLLASGDWSLRDFNGAIDSFVEAGRLTAEVGATLQTSAAQLDTARQKADEAQAVLNILRGVATDADFAVLGLAVAVSDAEEALGAAGPAGTAAAAGVDRAGEAARESTYRFDALRQSIRDTLRALDAAGALTGTGTSRAFNLTDAQEFHDGGLVGRDGKPRTVPSALFAFAPRFHDGFNLASDEFPAILQRGETVIPAGAAASGGGVVAVATEQFRELGGAIQEAGGSAGEFAIDLARILISAKSPLDALEKVVGNLSQRAFSFASQQFQAGNIGGGVLGLVGGVILGIIGNIIRRRRELQEAKQAWADMADQVADFGARLRGEGGGSLSAALSSARQEMEQYVAAAEKAQASTGDLAAMMEIFVTRQIRQFIGDFGVMMDALAEGLGADSPAVEATQNVISIGDALRGFVADTRKAVELTGADPAAIGAAQEAAAAYALSLLGTAPELSAVEEELRRIQGTSVHLQALLEDLGMSAEEAGQAVADGVTAALDRVRDQFGEDLASRLNDARGKGYLNDIADLIAERADLLNDANLLGIGSDSVGQIFALEAQAIVDGAGLVDDSFDELIDAFPELAGVVHESSDAVAEAMDRINDAASNVLGFLRGRLTGSGSTLSPTDRLSAAQQLFSQQLGLAQGGNIDAQAGLGTFAGDLLDAARDVYASSPAFQQILADVSSALLDLSAIANLNDPVLAELRNSIRAILGVESAVNSGAQSTTEAVEEVDASTQASLDLLDAVLQLQGSTNDVSNTISESILNLGSVTEDINVAIADNYFGPMVGYLEQIAEHTRQAVSGEQRELRFPLLARIFPGLFGSIYKAGGGLIPGFAGGGLIGNGIWNVDSVRAGYADGGSVMLAGGEFVTRAPSVNPATYATLDHINRTGRAPSNDNGDRRNFADLMRVVQSGTNASVLELRQGFGDIVDRLERVERAIKRSADASARRKSGRANAA